MVWKKGKKPEQYLFTITEDFSNDWKSFKKEAKENLTRFRYSNCTGCLCYNKSALPHI